MLKLALLCTICAVTAASAGKTEARCELQCAVHRLSNVGDFAKQLLGQKHKNTATPISLTKGAMCFHYCVATARRADICQGLIEWSIEKEDGGQREYSAAAKEEAVGECVLFLQLLDDVAAKVGYCAVIVLAFAVVVVPIGCVIKLIFCSWQV